MTTFTSTCASCHKTTTGSLAYVSNHQCNNAPSPSQVVRLVGARAKAADPEIVKAVGSGSVLRIGRYIQEVDPDMFDHIAADITNA